MTQQNHKQKTKLARKMRTNKEIRDRVNIFDSAEWNKRAEARQKKIITKKATKRIKEKRCPKCGMKLKLVKGETHTYKYMCKCTKKNIGVSIG